MVTRNRILPSFFFSQMTEKEEKAFLELLEKDADKREILHQLTAQRLKSADEYETLDLYGKTDN
jgi:hypothetical protein